MLPGEPPSVSPGRHHTRELSLGPFRLERRIGVGGMAAVWGGEHLASGVAVAIKVIHPEGSRAALWADQLRNEVRALARLDHPAIVPVLDQGEIPDEVAEASGGLLAARTPYFVMVRTNAGTLDDAPAPASYDELVALLARLLDALAHAHARGVIHRDVKPSNVLLNRGADGWTSALLSDFGIAHALRARDPGAPVHAGTPAYMAPEQIAGRMRDEGPATDLYALGCMIYGLTTGAPPFSGTTAQICRAQMLDVPPPLALAWPAPRAFFEWVATLLAKRPAHRFGTAAAARSALLSLDRSLALVAPAMRAPRRRVPASESTDRPTVAGSVEATAAAPLASFPVGLPGESIARARRPSLWPRAELAVDWRAATQAPRSQTVLGAGLGLYGLRTIPLAGREDERDQLWSRLVEVAGRERPHVVLLRGSAGVGKTRLAEWMSETALELGAAVALTATHGAQMGPADGLGPMLARHLRARDLAHESLSVHVQTWLHEHSGVGGSDRADAEDLAAIVEGRHERFANPGDRFAAMRRLIRRVTRGAPVVLVADDAVFGLDTLSFLESLSGSEPLPLLVIATAREEDLEQHRDAAHRLEALARSSLGSEHRVEPLTPESHARLVSELLGLEGALATEVAERTSGSPLFAVQLVGDWVQRGIVVPGPHGFQLREGAEAPIPDDIHGVWNARVARALSSVPEKDARVVLEIAAVLGVRVEVNEWRAACAVEGLSPPDAILAVAADAGLLRIGGTSARFVHGMLRESLERGAREADRLARHHRLCALIVEERGGDPERAAHHHLAARDPESAIPLLFHAIRRHLDAGDIQAAHRATARLDGALRGLGVRSDEPRATRAALARAEAYAVQGRLDDASEIADRLDPEALSRSDAATLAWMRGIVRQKRGSTAEARRCFADGRALGEALGDDVLVARCLYGSAECDKLLGKLDEARGNYEAAGALFHRAGHRSSEARVLTGLSDLEGRVGQLTRALELATESRGILEELGVRHSVAILTNGIGDLQRKSGRLDEAESSYRDAIRILEELGSGDVTIVRINLGLVALARGELRASDVVLAQVEQELEASGRAMYGRLTRTIRLAGAASLRDWARFDRDLAEAESGHESLVDPDVAWALERAVIELVATGETTRAARVVALAQSQWTTLGDHSGAARVASLLGRPS